MTEARASVRIPVDDLLAAYTEGWFPMAHADGELYWHRPDPRAIFELDTIPPPDPATARALRNGRFTTTRDQAFTKVVRACAMRGETWIDDRIIDTYTAMHDLGHAHSVEVWDDGKLVGGIYGLALGAAFFGESMFGVNNAGKAAFHALVGHLRSAGFVLFDTQYINPFTARLGAVEVPRAEFLRRLNRALELKAIF